MLVPPGSQLVLQRIITDVSRSCYSDPRFNNWLGLGTAVKIIGIVDRATTAGYLTLDIQDTADQEATWIRASGGVSPPNQDGGPFTTNGGTVSASEVGLLGTRRIFADVNFLGVSPASARVRVWASMRGAHLSFSRLLFQERLVGTSPIHASHEACTAIASADVLTLHISVLEVVSSIFPLVTVQLEESPNGQTWQDVPGAQVQVLGVEAGSAGRGDLWSTGTPPSGLVRLRVQLDDASSAATVKIWGTGRDLPGV